MAHEGREQKSERNIKTQSSHLDLLQVTIVQVGCSSDIWNIRRRRKATKIPQQAQSITVEM